MRGRNTRSHSTLIGRAPASLKFALLFIVSIAVYLLPSLGAQIVGLVIALAVVASCKPWWLHLLRSVAVLLGIISVVVVTTGFTSNWADAAMFGLRLLTVCLFAYSLTITTQFDDMLDFFTALMTPLEKVGANPRQIALSLSLTIRFIPEIRKIYVEVREAQMARGLQGSPVALVTPLVVRVLLSAEEVSEALDARSYDSQ